MKYSNGLVLGTLLLCARAFGGESVEIKKQEVTPLCHILAHYAAPGLLQLAIAAAEEESRIQCGLNAIFTSSSVSIKTLQAGCGTLVVDVKGSCFKP